MANIKWGYAINQWIPTSEHLTRREEQERAFKVMSVCGFRGVELNLGFGRWKPLGSPDQIELNLGSVKKFLDFLNSCGIDQVASYFFGVGRDHDPSNPTDHEKIFETAVPFAKFLNEVGGTRLVVRPMQSYWRVAPVTEEKIKIAADCWNKVGKMTMDYGVKTTLHIDFLCAIHSMRDVSKILEFTDSDYVGLTIDTAEVVIAGNDPIKLYEEFYDRVDHFHFKDTHNIDAHEGYKNEGAEIWLLDSGGKQGVERWFWEMGTLGGLVDFPELMKKLKEHGYKGWIIVESDQTPDPAESAMLNRWYIKNVLSKI